MLETWAEYLISGQGNATVMSRRLLGNSLRKLFAGKRLRREKRPNTRRLFCGFESLESRRVLAGVNGPHDADPNYNPQQSFHIHAGLSIFINDEKVTIPVFTTNPENIHTHDTSGVLHIHNFVPFDHFVNLKDVFDEWKGAVSGSNPNAVLSSTNLMNNLVDADHNLQM